MDKCQHNCKITHFCLYQYCSAKQSSGCQSCIKKYHSHINISDCIKTQEVDSLAQKFNLENSIKPKCRQLQQYVFAFFTLVKTQISQTIDIVCKGMVNKIGYPLLSNLNHLSSYKRIKNKQYKKISGKELKKFHMDCKGLQLSNVTIKQRQLYVEQIIQNFSIIDSLERIMKQYEYLANKLCKSFKHDSSAFKKIQDLKKYLNTILKLDKKQKQQKKDQKNDIQTKITKSNLQTSPSDQNSQTKYKSISRQQKSVIKSNNQKLINNKQQNIVHQQKQKVLTNANLNQKVKHQDKQKQKHLISQGSHLRRQIEQRQIENTKKSIDRTSRHKYKHLRQFSVQKQSKLTQPTEFDINFNVEQQNAYQSKQKQILQRKQKLMKMMTIKQKSVGKNIENYQKNQSNKNQKNEKNKQSSLLIAPPMLKYIKSQHFNDNIIRSSREQVKKPAKQQVYKLSQSVKSSDMFIKISTPQKTDIMRKMLSPSPKNYLTQSHSSKSLKNQLTIQNQQSKNQQNESDDKYKYAMMRLPSSQSNSSDVQIIFKSHLNKHNKNINKKNSFEINGSNQLQNKIKKDKMIQSTPLKLSQSNKIQDVVTDQQKSVGLYFLALELNNPDQIIKYLKASLSYSPKNITAAQYLSNYYLQQNKAKQCLNLCNQYLNTLTKMAKNQCKKTFIINKAASLNILGRYSESITFLQSQVIHYQDSKIYKNLGDAYFFVGINQKCQYNYQKAIKLDGKLDQAMYNLAVCMYSQRNYFNADVWIVKALQINRNNVEYQTLKKEVVKKLDQVHQDQQFNR